MITPSYRVVIAGMALCGFVAVTGCTAASDGGSLITTVTQPGPVGTARITATVTVPAPVTDSAGASTSAGTAGTAGTADAADTLAPPLRPGVEIPPGRVQAAVARLDDLADDIMAKSGIPGMAVAVVYQGKMLYAKGFGVRKAGAAGKVDADTVFQLASLSKSVGATVVAHEVAAGTVSWDTPVHKNLPSFSLADPWVSRHLTIADLYAHRSGLPDHAGDLLEDLGYSESEILHRLRVLPLDPFRSSYHYTNFGITAAADSVAAAAGTNWATLSDKVLYSPLGMTSTSSRFADYADNSDRAWTHVEVDGAWRVGTVRDADAQAPAGGVSSSVHDLAKWMIMVLNNGTGGNGAKITTATALKPALTPQIVSSPAGVPAARASFYGYGFDISNQPSGRVQISHSGAFNAGAATSFMLNPLAGFGIVTLTNAAPIGAAEALNQEFNDLAVYGSTQADWWTLYHGRFQQAVTAPFGELVGKKAPAHPSRPAALSTYAGVYHNAFAGDAEVLVQNNALYLTLGPKKMRFALTHWDGNVFTYIPTGEGANPGSISAVRFTRSGTAPARSMDIEYYDQDNTGPFTR